MREGEDALHRYIWRDTNVREYLMEMATVLIAPTDIDSVFGSWSDAAYLKARVVDVDTLKVLMSFGNHMRSWLEFNRSWETDLLGLA